MLSGIQGALSSLATQFAETPSAQPASAAEGAQGGFGDVLRSAVQSVDGLQSSADLQIGNLLQGAANTDVNHVMVSVEKADIAFQLMMQVRNKVVSAYQDIEKMQF